MRLNKLMAALLILVALAPVVKAGQHYGDIAGAVYVRNYDGDTITVDLPGIHPLFGDDITVRISGIDTPEVKGKCDQERLLAHNAQALVKARLAVAKTILLAEVGRDKYFRINARVVADGADLGALLISRGLAVAYDGGTKTHNWCAQ